MWRAQPRINRERALQSCNRGTGLHRPHSAWRAHSPRPAECPPPLPAALAVLRRASGHEPVLFSRDAGGWLGRRPGGVRADRRGSSAARHQAVGLELVGSLPAHSAALLSGERRRLTTACVCSRGLAPPRAAPRLHSAWPRLLACARLGHAPLPVPQARRLGGLAQPSLLALSGHLGGSSAQSKRARHSGAHGRLRATLPASRLASPRLAVARCGPRLAPWHEGCACGGYSRARRALGRLRVRTPPPAGLPQVVRARRGALVAAVWVPGGRLPRTREEERGVLARRGAARGARQK